MCADHSQPTGAFAPDKLELAEAAERAAEAQLPLVPDYLWDGSSVPVPVEDIAENHYRLLVELHDDLAASLGRAGETISGFLIPDTRVIGVDSEEAGRAPGRRRFTVAHEVGHWVIHCALGASSVDEAVLCRARTVKEDPQQNETADSPVDGMLDYPAPELEANQFAAAMLMPAGLVVEEVGRSRDVAALAERFGVSSWAMERRLFFLERTGRLDHLDRDETRSQAPCDSQIP